MKGFYQVLSLILVCLSVIAGLTFTSVNPVAAQSTDPKFTPTIPEFTVRYVNNSHYTQPITTTTTDPYTGQPTTTTKPSSYVQEEYVEVKIKNMTYTPYLTSNLWFNVRYKGHYVSEWKYVNPNPYENYSAPYTYVFIYYNRVPNGEVDFQVQAINGHQTPSSPSMFPQSLIVEGQAGGWSDIQTIKLPEGTVTITPYTNPEPTPTLTTTATQTPELSATPTPTVPEMQFLIILPLLLSIIFTALVVKLRKIVSING